MNQQLRSTVARIGFALSALALTLIGLVSMGFLGPQTAFSIGSLGSMIAFGTFLTNDDAIKYLISIGFLDAAGGLKLPVKIKTADYTIVTGTDASGTVFTNRGAIGTVIFTLPAPSQSIAGVFYDFIGLAAQTLTVKTATADTLIAFNDATADSMSVQTASELIGVSMRAVCDGTSWIALGTAVGIGGANAATYTVAT